MWSIHHRDYWKDLDEFEEPTDVGRRLDVGGFILADPFETFLRNVSKEYLHEAWGRLSNVLARYQTEPDDLSWGFFHPGETHVPGNSTVSPLDFVGWMSRQLANFDHDSRYHRLDEQLKNGSPALRCAVTWRSLKWRIAPENYELALRLLEALCTDEVTNWSPQYILKHAEEGNDTWHQIARAMEENNQQQLDQAIAQAKSLYSPLGYRIVVRGFAALMSNGGSTTDVHLPNL